MIHSSSLSAASTPIRLDGLNSSQLLVMPTQQPDEWVVVRSPALAGSSKSEVLATVTVPADATVATNATVTAFAGKGGFSLLLATPTAVVIALSGSSGQWEGITFNVAGQSPIHQPQPFEPQPVTPQRVTTQAMILGAGLATRFEPVSGDWTGVSKPGTPIAGSASVIRLLVEHLAQFGMTDIFINTYYKPDQLKQSLAGDGLPRIHYIDEDEPSGTAGALKTLLLGNAEASVQAAFDATQPLLVVQGDAVTNADLGALLVAHQQQQAAVTLGCMIKGDDDVPKFGIVVTDHADGHNGRIQTFLEKPSLEAAGPHRLANTGFYVFSPQSYPWVLQAAEKKSAADILDFALDVFPQVMTNCNDPKALQGLGGGFWAQEISGYWSDIGNPAQYGQTVNDWYTNHPMGHPIDHPIGHPHGVSTKVFRGEDAFCDGEVLQSLTLLHTGVILWPNLRCDQATQWALQLQGTMVVAPAACSVGS